jgi:hypothetical protein
LRIISIILSDTDREAFEKSPPYKLGYFRSILRSVFMMFLMPLIIRKDENPPSDNHCEGKLMLQPMERQQDENDKKTLDGKCSLEVW